MTGPVLTKVAYEELIARANELEVPVVGEDSRCASARIAAAGWKPIRPPTSASCCGYR